ncbi:MOSC domain-containing protein [Simplicispira suum]|uniref:MOSC domain-containing protein n=1 Tax=Simplicispira suum TaxID=2109915 RepID=UPI001FE3527E|nr:MOSC domain-containing protein [Simplicispira suum]
MKAGTVLGHVLAVCTGQTVPYARGSISGIAKQARSGPVFCSVLGLAGDAQGDLRVHGGPDKAVHHYASEHYAAWRQELGASAVLDAPAAFGENLHSVGLTESDVCLGDQVRVGEALLEVSQARQPCWKLNERFGRTDMARQLQNTRRTGWYYRVLEEGALWAGAELLLQERPHPQWSMARLLDVLYRPSLDAAELRAALALPLPPNWERLIARRLDSGAVESWASRLEGPAA